MSTFIQILTMVGYSIVVLAIYHGLKTYLLHKIKISKWIVLGIAVLLFVAPMLIWPTMPSYVSKYVVPGVFLIFALWFMDLAGLMRKRNVTNTNTNYKKDKKNDIVMRPKAKPNRVKNNKK